MVGYQVNLFADCFEPGTGRIYEGDSLVYAVDGLIDRTDNMIDTLIVPADQVGNLMRRCFGLLGQFRTSSATTANPRPCSPARAASIAAFSAKRLV